MSKIREKVRECAAGLSKIMDFLHLAHRVRPRSGSDLEYQLHGRSWSIQALMFRSAS